MKREIIITDDGSTTIRIPEWDENYHSTHGAIQEAKHVFIKNGLDLFHNQDSISILEIGFGTGLNAFITFLETLNKEKVNYVGVEAYPISTEEVLQMNYVSELQATDFKPICKPKKFEITSPLFVEEMFDIINEKCFCFMHFDDTSMEYTELIDQYKTFPVVYRYDGNKYQIPENKGQRFFDFNFTVRNDIFSKTKYYIDFRNDNKFNINIIEALKNKCVVYLPNTEKNKKLYSHQNVKFFGKKIDPNQTFCDNVILDYSFPNCDQIVSDILSKHLFVKKSKFYI